MLEQLVVGICCYSGFFVPVIALWAVASLYCSPAGQCCSFSQLVFFAAFLLISGLTLRTVAVDNECFLVHSVSLGAMVVGGVMRPVGHSQDSDPLADVSG